MRISLLNYYNRFGENAISEQTEITWQQLVKILSNHKIQKEKVESDATQFSPWEYKGNKSKAAQFALRSHFGVVDLDDINKEQLDFVKSRLKNISYVISTTWSHTRAKELAGNYRLRVAFPLSRPIEVSEWSRFWSKLYDFFGKYIDAEAKGVGHAFLLPACQDKEDAWALQNAGEPLDVEKLLLTERFDNHNVIKWEDLKELAKKLAKSRSDYRKEFAEVIQLGLQGLPLADVGERDSTLFKLAALLADTFEDFNPKDLSQLFHKSITTMQADSGGINTPTWFEDKLLRAKERADLLRLERQTQQEAQQRLILKELFDGTRETPYSTLEFESFAEQQGCSTASFQKRWIIYHCGSYYIYFNGKYLDAQVDRDLVGLCNKYLAPASTCGVSTKKIGAKGESIPKNFNELIFEYGTPALSIECSLSAKCSYYDSQRGVFVDATTPLQITEAKYDPVVEEFLRLLAGEDFERLKDYLSAFIELNRPAAALYLHGPPGAGKDVLVKGLARLWTRGSPTMLASAIGANFTQDISRCPLIFANESMPKSFKEHGSTGDWRELIQATSRRLTVKYKSNSELFGCIRLIMAANNADMLGTKEEMTQEDIDAIVERVFYINITDDRSARYLIKLGPEAIVDMIESGKIAKYVLWLNQTHKVKEKTRFIVSGKDSIFHKMFAVGSGLSSAICHWIISYLQNPQKINLNAKDLIFVRDGEIFITQKSLNDYWDMYTTHTAPQTPAKISKALVRVCHNQKKSVKLASVGPRKFWQVDLDNLYAWAEFNNYVSKEELQTYLSKDTIIKKPDTLERLLDVVNDREAV